MGSESNIVTKKFLQKIINHLLEKKDFSDISKAEVYFAFGTPHRTAMCEYVYGIKVSIKNKDPYLISKLQSETKSIAHKRMNMSVCCTDVIFNN
jgi:hypothetical protein